MARGLAALLTWSLVAALPWAPATSAAGVLFDTATPEAEIITRAAPGGGHLSLRAERRQITLWGQPLAVLVYSGPLAQGQEEFHDGRYSLITIPRRPAEDVLFLQRQVWPALGSSSLDAGGFRGLRADDVVEPGDARLKKMEDNLLRASWSADYRDAAAGRGGWTRRRLRDEIVQEGERNGFLHEAQHALDEAHRAHPGQYSRPFIAAHHAELRAHLAAIAHASRPHHALYFALRQYRQRLPLYEPAFAELMAGLVAAVHSAAVPPRELQLHRNLMLQLPRLRAADLRRYAAAAMESLFAGTDREAGYSLEYGAVAGAASDLRLGTLRGDILPADLAVRRATVPGERVAAAWELTEPRVLASGSHVYLSSEGARLARGDRLGVLLEEGGFLAAHLLQPAGPGPWSLVILGGLDEEPPAVEIRGGDAPLELLAPGPLPGSLHALLPPAAAGAGLIRVILSPLPGSQAPVLIHGLRLLQDGPQPGESPSRSDRVKSDSRR